MDDTKPKLKPFIFHGVEFTSKTGTSQVGDCPFCDKQKSFHVNEDTGQWVCSSSPDRCGRQGNIITFLEQYMDHVHENTPPHRWAELSEWRGTIPPVIFKRERIGYDERTDSWLIPSRTAEGRVTDLRTLRWKTKRRKIMATAGCSTGLFGAELIAKSSDVIYVCEGEWDAIALRWLLRKADAVGIVVAVPGARIFKDEWVALFKGRNIVFCYDADADGDTYAMKAAKKIGKKAGRIEFINWPEELPPGFDVRDFIVQFLINEEMDAAKVLENFHSLLSTRHRRDVDAVATASTPEKRVRPKSNPSFEETLNVYRKHLRMTEDLEQALLVLFSIVFSNQACDDEPLWLFLVGPPGSGKTELLQSMMTVPDVLFQSSVGPRQLVSGWKTKNEDDDPSLIPRMIDHVTIFKDWTEMLGLHPQALQEVVDIFRGAYDGHVHKEFGHGVIRDYHGRFTILAGVTNAIHGHSTATMGERFLKYQLEGMNMESMFHTLSAALRSVGKGKVKNDALQAAALAFLDRDVPRLEVDDMIDKEMEQRINALAAIVGIMRHIVERGRDGEVKFKQAAEVGTRLTKQLAKLAMNAAYVLGKPIVDDEVFLVVQRVAFDTAIGFNIDLVQAAFELGGVELFEKNLHDQTGIPSSTVHRHVEDLCLLKVMVPGKKLVPLSGGSPKSTYKLSLKMRLLWKATGIEETNLKSAIAARK